MQGPNDLQQLGPVIKEQQKVIDSALEKKIQLAKIQSALVQKDLTNNSSGPGFSLEDRETLNTLLNKEKDGGDDTTEYKM